MNVSGFVFVPHGTGGSALVTGDPALVTGDPAVFLTGAFHEGAEGRSRALTGLPWLSPGLARGPLECMTSGPW